jgi:hypothetical protein
MICHIQVRCNYMLEDATKCKWYLRDDRSSSIPVCIDNHCSFCENKEASLKALKLKIKELENNG